MEGVSGDASIKGGKSWTMAWTCGSNSALDAQLK